ncbi:16881_t:CDS:2 [Funneliformis caledonium]|uniref:16881_t:CDS:1 n=1 Tax=Funneliformis caledonium TaxID=1117310 RepID=A0A9N9GNF3_9GLOM|nr:16881_t:CDS:2 [Funneliformis caledonium]
MSNEREKRARLRKRHVKCDGDYPICGNCKSVNGECSYSHPGSKRGYVETIDDRLNKIEQVLSKYLEGVDTQQQYSKSSVTKDINNDPELDVHDIVNMAKSLKIKESSETAQILSDSMSPSILKSNTRYVTPKKKEVSDITFHSNLSPKGSMEDLQNSSKDSKKIQSLEPPLPKVYRGSKELPPKDLFDHLIQTYLSYGYSSRGPIIHKPTFIKQLRDKNNQPSLLLLNAIFAVASIFSDDTRTRTDPDDPGTAGDVFWTRALSLLDDFMDRGRLSTVQAVRTRVFWAAMNAEVLVCASFGKPLPVYDYNTKFPYEIDDDGDEAQDVVNYMHYSKLMKIYGNVLQSKSYFSQPGALRNTLPAIDAALSSWVLALPPHLQYNPDYSDQNSISVFCSYLNQMYNTVVISLHRPYIDSDEFPNFNSRDICIKAAINITKLSNYIPVDSQGIYLTFSASAYCLVQAATMHILNIGDPDYSHIGQKYMEQTFKSLRKIAQGVRLGHGHCGVDDAINMLEYLYQVQLSKIQDDSEAQNFIRLKSIPTSPPSSHQQDSADGDSIKSASLSIIKTEKSPMLLDRTQQQPSSTSLSLGPRKPLSVEVRNFQSTSSVSATTDPSKHAGTR